MAKRRKKRPASGPRQRQQPKAAPNKQKVTVNRTRLATRLAFLGTFGLGLGIAGGIYVSGELNELKSGPSLSTPVTPKSPEMLDGLILGNVRFVLQNPEAISDSQKQALFEMMNSAYSRLVNEFGDELMQWDEPLDLPIIIDRSFSKNKKGELNMGKIDVVTNNLGEPIPTQPNKPTSLNLRQEVPESTLAHEFVHLYLQASVMLSDAFKEGHAYAITNKLYNNREVTDPIFSTPEIEDLLNFPVDFMGHAGQPGFRPNKALYSLYRVKWRNDWLKVNQNDPDFFKNFYAQLARMRQAGKHYFTRGELIKMAEKTSPAFSQTLESGSIESLRRIGETGSITKVGCYRTHNPNLIILSNMKTVPTVKNQMTGGIQHGFFRQAVPGKSQSLSVTLNGNPIPNLNIRVMGDAMFMFFPVPPGLVDEPNLKITLGGTPIPFKN